MRGARKCLIGAGRQRLFYEFHPRLSGDGEQAWQLRGSPGFVGVGHEARIGARCTDLPEARGIENAAAEFQFQQGHIASGFGLRRHRIGGVEAQGEAGRQRPGRTGKPESVRNRSAGLFRREIPEGAVERIARGACRQTQLQRRLVGDIGHRTDLRHDAVDGFAVAGIGHAFAPPLMLAVVKRCDDDGRGRARTARNRE